ncbi:uncharacterized protein LOC144153317 isoform X2 [Haemaphysalis longicornis]
MKATVLGVCLVMSAISAIMAQKVKAPLFCPLEMQEKLSVMGCVWDSVSTLVQRALQYFMSYYRLNPRLLTRLVCSPFAVFQIKRAFPPRYLKEAIDAGIKCLLRRRPGVGADSDKSEEE